MLRVLGQTGIGFGVGIFLARTLEVKDFGLMAIAMILIGLAEMISSLGVEASLIQRLSLTIWGLFTVLLLVLAALGYVAMRVAGNHPPVADDGGDQKRPLRHAGR